MVNFQLLLNQPRSGQVQLDDGRVSLDSNSHFGPTERGFDRFDGGNRRMKKMKMDEGPLKKNSYL